MLAQQHGLALITEKLQNQRLEEPAAGSSGVTPSGTTSSFCSKLPSVNQEAYLISDHPDQSKALSVKGKNVWAVSLDSDRPRQGSPGWQPDGTSGATLLPLSSPRGSTHPTDKDQSAPVLPPPSLCRHRKLRHYCQICDTAPGTPSAPPKKKHCRSLSVPPDGPSTVSFFPSGKDATSSPTTRFSIGTAGYGHSSYHHHHHHHHHHHQSHHGSKIWKPIAVVPLRCSPASNNNNSPVNSATGYNTNSRHRDRSLANAANQASVNNDDDDKNNNIGNNNNSSSIMASVSGNDQASPSPSRLGSCSSSSLFKFKLVPPSSFSSSGSFDSGHFTTSDLQTPPSSPIPQPRPASATSDTSHGSAGWLEFSPMRSRVRVLQNRSLSCEDRISGCCACPCSSSSSTATSMPCVYNSSSANAGGSGGGSGAGRGSVIGCCAEHSGGSGSEVVPRCHSQPCVLHHRRLGKKRRRDCDRPTLNFNKMTETAYTHSHRRSDLWTGPLLDAQMGVWSGFGHHPSPSLGPNPFVLNPIASSPLDSSEHLMSKHLQQPLAAAAAPPHQSRARGGGGGGYSHQVAGERLEGAAGLGLSAPLLHPGGRSRSDAKGNDEDEEEDDDDEEEEEDEDSRNCSCHDSQREPDSIGLFPMADLDLEQIETH